MGFRREEGRKEGTRRIFLFLEEKKGLLAVDCLFAFAGFHFPCQLCISMHTHTMCGGFWVSEIGYYILGVSYNVVMLWIGVDVDLVRLYIFPLFSHPLPLFHTRLGDVISVFLDPPNRPTTSLCGVAGVVAGVVTRARPGRIMKRRGV